MVNKDKKQGQNNNKAWTTRTHTKRTIMTTRTHDGYNKDADNKDINKTDIRTDPIRHSPP